LEEDGVMAERSSSPQSTQRRYPPELKERAVRLVREVATEQGERHGAITRVARTLGIGAESVRLWVRQAEVDTGERAGLTTEERARLKQLERENRELRRANEILRSASAFFAFMSPSEASGGLARFFGARSRYRGWSSLCRPPGALGPCGVT
jgi:transposase